MSTNCDACGYRDNEVKSGSAISERGKKIILRVEDREDLSRDLLKVRLKFISAEPLPTPLWSETCKGAVDTRNRIGITGWDARWKVYNIGGNPESSI